MLTTKQVRARLKERVKAAGGAAAWGRATCVSPSYLGDVLKGRREPGAAVLRPLGLRRMAPAYAEVATPTSKSSSSEASAS